MDYRRLNKLAVFDPEPMPTSEHLFQKLNGDKYFTRVDLSKGYWQISIPEEDIPKIKESHEAIAWIGQR